VDRDDALDEADLDACLRTLERVAGDRALLATVGAERRRALQELAGQLARPARAERKRLERALRKRDREARNARDLARLARAHNRAERRAPGHVLPASTARSEPPVETEAVELERDRACYVCKAPFRRLHHFYDSLCPPCAELNFAKRSQWAGAPRLDGQVALVTGARIKIGYQVALMLLRAGAQVIATSRFPFDAAARFVAEPDFADFAPRLALHGLDLRHLPSVERLGRRLRAELPRLDLLVNNAAQTVRRPPAFYAQRVADEDRLAAAPELARLVARAAAPALDGDRALAHASPLASRMALQPLAPDDLAWSAAEFPPGARDLDGEPVDLRRDNSWRMRLGEVSTVELLEVHLVNAAAPFVLARELRPLMARDRDAAKHVINVSAMEASFARRKKTDKHPHTNMAKASLNMMTRTAADDFARDGIFMNSVDTGWVTDEDPVHHVARKQRVHDFHPPLDAIDGAARVLDPLWIGLQTGRHPSGRFFKDYRETDW
jgi:NAD(P)-dependent dehydrogenase (short-subunit alcohol dehydrogenase family)